MFERQLGGLFMRALTPPSGSVAAVQQALLAVTVNLHACVGHVCLHGLVLVMVSQCKLEVLCSVNTVDATLLS